VGQVIGKTGKVVSVDRDGDVKVKFDGRKWIFNPQCCMLVSQSQGQGQGRPTSVRQSAAVNLQSSSDDDDDDDNSK